MPLVSCLVPTMPTRKIFWPMVFKCFQNQNWPEKELVFIGEEPLEIELPLNVRYLEMPKETSIGAKLNAGVESSKANYFHKWDDDDYYYPDFLQKLIPPLFKKGVAVSFVNTHLMLILGTMELYEMPVGTIGGGTVCFDRKAWEERPFEDKSFGEDFDFFLNRQSTQSITPKPLNYILVRHGRNTWLKWSHGETVEKVAEINGKKIQDGPRRFLPKEDLEFYCKIKTQ